MKTFLTFCVCLGDNLPKSNLKAVWITGAGRRPLKTDAVKVCPGLKLFPGLKPGPSEIVQLSKQVTEQVTTFSRIAPPSLQGVHGFACYNTTLEPRPPPICGRAAVPSCQVAVRTRS